MTSSVFITRNASDSPGLIEELIRSGFNVQAIPLIRSEPIAFDRNIPETDWIFFSSSNAVRFFFQANPIIQHQFFAAIGDATARTLTAFRLPDFTGSSSDIQKTALEFAEIAANASVLFPGPETGIRQIQKALNPSQIVDLICYRTIPTPLNVGFPDILVFSSPSNVESFFQINAIQQHQRFIAFGSSTALSLKKHGIVNPTIPKSLSDEDLLQAIKHC